MALPKAEKARRKEILENLKSQGFIQIIGCENYWICRNGQVYSSRTNRIMAQQINNTYLGLTLTRFGEKKRFPVYIHGERTPVKGLRPTPGAPHE